MFSPLHTRSIIKPFPFETVRKPQEKESSNTRPMQPDPPPKNNWNYEKAAVGIAGMTLGGLGTWYAGKTLYNLIPSWKGANVTEARGLSSHNALGWGKSLYSLPGSQALPMLYLGKISLRTMLAGMLTTKMAADEKKRGRLDLAGVYRDVHQQGIQGQGFKIGVIDLFPDKKDTKRQKRDIYSFQKELTDLREAPHGPGVSSVIQAAVPKAKIIHFSAPKSSKALSDLDNVFEEYRHKPEELTFAVLRQVLRPYIMELSTNLKGAVDSGVNVVNVSLAPEQILTQVVASKFIESQNANRWQSLKKVLLRKSVVEPSELETAYRNQLERLLTRDGNLDERVRPASRELLDIYQPWFDALVYAAKKNVLVVVASGNSGNAPKDAKLEGFSHINPLGLKPSGLQNVIVVGSTNDEGKSSDFSSEYNNKVQPDIAANGSGQINSRGIMPRLSARLAWKNPTAPILLASAYHNPFGTSFAAPDITGLYVLIQSAREKDGKPPLSIEEFKKVLSLSAQPVSANPDTKWLHDIDAYRLSISERDELDRQWESRGAVWEILGKRHQETGLSNQEKLERIECTNGFHDQMIEPLTKQREELDGFERQLSEQLQKEEVLRKTGQKGTIAGHRLHAVSVARQYETEKEQAQRLQDID